MFITSFGRTPGKKLALGVAALALFLPALGCRRMDSALGPWSMEPYNFSGTASQGGVGMNHEGASFGGGRSVLLSLHTQKSLPTKKSLSTDRKFVVVLQAGTDDKGGWDSESTSLSEVDGIPSFWTRLTYSGSEQGMDCDVGILCPMEPTGTVDGQDSWRVKLGNRSFECPGDSFLLFSAERPGSPLYCPLDPSWPDARTDAVGLLEAVCANEPEIAAVLLKAR